MKESPELKTALAAKQILPEEKQDLLEKVVYKGMKNQSEVGRAVLMKMVLDEAFEKEFDDTCVDYERLVYAELGITQAEVITAVPLSKAQQSKITQKLNSLVAKGESVEMDVKVDPTILGGLVVRLGERAQDLSVSSRLTQLETGIRAIA